MQSDPVKNIHISVPGDSALETFLYHVALETMRARVLFPGTKQQLAAADEEHGEMAQALLDHDRGEVADQAVWEEAVQAAAMAARTGIEGSMEFPKYKMPAIPLPAGTLKSALNELAEKVYLQRVKVPIGATPVPFSALTKKQKAMWRAIAVADGEDFVGYTWGRVVAV